MSVKFAPQVDWHKNVPEDQPEDYSHVYIHFIHKSSDPTLSNIGIRQMLSQYIPLSDYSIITYWAYIPTPQPPEIE